MGNRTQYVDMVEPVIIPINEFLKYVFLPSLKPESSEKEGLSPLPQITQWRDGNYVKLILERWWKNLAANPDYRYKEGKWDICFCPKTFPIPFGYA